MMMSRREFKVVKGEIHHLLSVMRSDSRYASALRFSSSSSSRRHNYNSSSSHRHNVDPAIIHTTDIYATIARQQQQPNSKSPLQHGNDNNLSYNSSFSISSSTTNNDTMTSSSSVSVTGDSSSQSVITFSENTTTSSTNNNYSSSSHHPLLTSLLEVTDRMEWLEQQQHLDYADDNDQNMDDYYFYLNPFITAVVSRDICAKVTGTALASLHKFILYGFIQTNIGLTRIARCLRHVQFHSTNTNTNNSSEEEQQVVLKLLSTSTSILQQCSTTTTNEQQQQQQQQQQQLSLSCQDMSDMFDTCHSISQNSYASPLLQSAAADALSHVVLHVCQQYTTKNQRNANNHSETKKTALLVILSRLIHQLNPNHHNHNNHQKKSSSPLKRSSFYYNSNSTATTTSNYTTTTTATTSYNNNNSKKIEEGIQLALTLINMVLESTSFHSTTHDTTTTTATTSTIEDDENWKMTQLLQNKLCQELLRLSTTTNLRTLTLTLRVIFNLFQNNSHHHHSLQHDDYQYLKKIQLEIFLTSVHLRIISSSTSINNNTAATTSCIEVALESLLEFCKEPALIQDIYCNYDCDVQCTNLFENICLTLSQVANLHLQQQLQTDSITTNTTTEAEDAYQTTYPNGNHHHPPVAKFTIFHILACDGLLAIIESIAKRCQIINSSDINSEQEQCNQDASSSNDNRRNNINDEKNNDYINVVEKDMESSKNDSNNNYENGNIVDKVEDDNISVKTLESEDTGDNVSSFGMPTPPNSMNHHHNKNKFGRNDSNNNNNKAQWLKDRKERKHRLVAIAKEFNEHTFSNKWIEMAQQASNNQNNKEAILPTPVTEEAVAQFLYNTPQLDKTQVGLYLSKGPSDKYPFHAKVLKHFCHQYHPFPSSFSDAIRTFLLRFRLPGEAQCIDRLMEAFANSLFSQQIENTTNNTTTKNTTPPIATINTHNNDSDNVVDETKESVSGDDNLNQESNDRNDTNAIKHDDLVDLSSSQHDSHVIQQSVEDDDNLSHQSSNLVDSVGSSQGNTNINDAYDDNDHSDSRVVIREDIMSNNHNTSSKLPFKSADAAFVLSFSTIMLNTDLHNPTIKDERRMTLEQFIRNNRGINDNEDLPVQFLTDLYNQIKEKEIQVERSHHSSSSHGPSDELHHTNLVQDYDVFDNTNRRRSIDPPCFTPLTAKHAQIQAGVHERDMFATVAPLAIQCISNILVQSWDDVLVMKALKGVQNMAQICLYFEMDRTFNDILLILLKFGKDYISSVVTLAISGYDIPIDSSSVDDSLTETDNHSIGLNGSIKDENDRNFGEFVPFPHALRISSQSSSTSSYFYANENLVGCAAHRGLLSLDCALFLIQTHVSAVREAWPHLMDCIFALKDANALPPHLSELDDFADSRGNLLSASPFALRSHYRAYRHIQSVANVTNKDAKSSGFWGTVSSIFTTTTDDGSNHQESSIDEDDEFDIDSDSDFFSSDFGRDSENIRIKPYIVNTSFSPDMMAIFKSSHIGHFLVGEKNDLAFSKQMMKILLDYAVYDETRHKQLSLLTPNVDIHSTKKEWILTFEHRSTYALELAARALFTNRHHALELYPMFLSCFESILNEPSFVKKKGGKTLLRNPYLMERAIVTILRCGIHMYDIPEMRPHLKHSFLLLLDLPSSFLKHIVNRMSCGFAIILRSSYSDLQSAEEWSIVGDLLDRCAKFEAGRRFIFDGVASCVEDYIPSPEYFSDKSRIESKDDEAKEIKSTDFSIDSKNPFNNTPITFEGAYMFARLLLKFIFGSYGGDSSLSVPSMFCLEKTYWYLYHMATDQSALDGKNEPMDPVVPDEDLWNTVSSAFYNVCLSEKQDTAIHGLHCLERFFKNTELRAVSDVAWITVLDTLTTKLPPVQLEVARIKATHMLGNLLLHLIPVLCKRDSNYDALTEIVSLTADYVGENLRTCNMTPSNDLFDDTVETFTKIINELSLSDSKNLEFCMWTAEIFYRKLDTFGVAEECNEVIKARVKSTGSESDNGIADRRYWV